MASLGDRKYLVEWCIEVPCDTDSGERLVDEAKCRRKIVNSYEEALDLAAEKMPETVVLFGPRAVEITEVEYVDPYGDNLPWTFRWEPCGDTVYYDVCDAES